MLFRSEVRREVAWMDYLDAEAIETMLNMEGDVFVVTNEKPSYPSTFIVPAMGQLNNWTWVGFSKNMGKEFCNTSSDVLFNIFNKMNSNLTYFDVSHNIEILHLNDSNEFENEINKQLGNKLNLWNQLSKLLIWAMIRIHT